MNYLQAARRSASIAPAGIRTAVVLVCHPGYLHFLPAALQSIDVQSPSFDKKVLVYDAGTAPQEAPVLTPDGWHLIIGSWANPNSARNAGLQQCGEVDWVCFWDADNEMTADHLIRSLPVLESVESGVAICYPEVQKVTNGEVWHRRDHPEWSRVEGQRRSLCDTSSFWRRQALEEVGAFSPEQCQHDDYELSLRLYRAGWKGKKLPVTLQHHFHGENRSRRTTPEDEERITRSLYTAWSFAFVTLWGARTEASVRVLQWLADAEIPPLSHLYWVDNSGGTMTALLQEWSARLAGRYRSITIISAGDPHTPAAGEPYLSKRRHQQVARLYNLVFNRITDEMVVTLEDDMLPPRDGVGTLLHLMRPFSRVAMAAGVYRSRNSPHRICAAVSKGAWTKIPEYDSLPATPFEVGMTGGGFAMIANWALQEALPMRCEISADGSLMGWDGNLGRSLTSLGYQLMAHPKVSCQHLCPEVTDYLGQRLKKTILAGKLPAPRRRRVLQAA